jgi:hypothetical protein
MMNHGIEQLARQRISERLGEAERGRLARAVPAEPKFRRSWPERLTLSVVRRLSHVAEAL